MGGFEQDVDYDWVVRQSIEVWDRRDEDRGSCSDRRELAMANWGKNREAEDRHCVEQFESAALTVSGNR